MNRLIIVNENIFVLIFALFKYVGFYTAKLTPNIEFYLYKFRVFEANKPMLKDPDLIYPRQMLIIPPPDK